MSIIERCPLFGVSIILVRGSTVYSSDVLMYTSHAAYLMDVPGSVGSWWRSGCRLCQVLEGCEGERYGELVTTG